MNEIPTYGKINTIKFVSESMIFSGYSGFHYDITGMLLKMVLTSIIHHPLINSNDYYISFIILYGCIMQVRRNNLYHQKSNVLLSLGTVILIWIWNSCHDLSNLVVRATASIKLKDKFIVAVIFSKNLPWIVLYDIPTLVWVEQYIYVC